MPRQAPLSWAPASTPDGNGVSKGLGRVWRARVSPIFQRSKSSSLGRGQTRSATSPPLQLDELAMTNGEPDLKREDLCLSQIAELCSRIAGLEAQLRVAEEAAKLALLAMQEKKQEDIDSLQRLLVQKSAMLETHQAELANLRYLLQEAQANLSLYQREIADMSLAVQNNRAEKEALRRDISGIQSTKSQMQEELISARSLILSMQENESKVLSAFKEEIASVVEERDSLRTQIHGYEDQIMEMASSASKELKEAHEVTESMRFRLEKESEDPR